jgi:hypothetical protein
MRKLCFVCFIAFILLFGGLIQICFAIDRIDAADSLAKAENDLASAYVATAEAERAGSNISELLVKLESAGALLASAYNFYTVGDYGEAYLYATNCSDRVDGIVSEAAGLKLEAEDAYRENLFVMATLSSAGLSMLFVLSLFAWRFLKNRYVKRVLEMKPEVGKAK